MHDIIINNKSRVQRENKDEYGKQSVPLFIFIAGSRMIWMNQL